MTLQPRKTKYKFDADRLEEYILLHGAPPRNASCCGNGYWTLACKEIFGRNVNSNYTKAVANHFYCNLNGLKTRVLERLSVSSYVHTVLSKIECQCQFFTIIIIIERKEQ